MCNIIETKLNVRNRYERSGAGDIVQERRYATANIAKDESLGNT